MESKANNLNFLWSHQFNPVNIAPVSILIPKKDILEIGRYRFHNPSFKGATKGSPLLTMDGVRKMKYYSETLHSISLVYVGIAAGETSSHMFLPRDSTWHQKFYVTSHAENLTRDQRPESQGRVTKTHMKHDCLCHCQDKGCHFQTAVQRDSSDLLELTENRSWQLQTSVKSSLPSHWDYILVGGGESVNSPCLHLWLCYKHNHDLDCHFLLQQCGSKIQFRKITQNWYGLQF